MPSARPRFHVAEEGARVTISFDDGGMNLLSRAALEELQQRVESLRASRPAVRVVAFRSGRPNLFAAGADMREMSGFSGQDAEALARIGQEVFAALESLQGLTVALIDGDCFGGALDLAMAFDLRLATPRSRFSHPGARIGIVTGYGGTSRWRRILEVSSSRALLLGNEVLDPSAALKMGLVGRLVEDLEAELMRLVHVDCATIMLVKELTTHAPRLSQRELTLLAERLGELYSLG